MKIKLISDHHQFYDHAFYPNGEITYTRNQRNNQTRAEMFRYLEFLGFKTPPHGLASIFIPTHIELLRQQGFYEEPEIELATSIDDKSETQRMLETEIRQLRTEMYREQSQVVVHTDEFAHCGEGKKVMDYRSAMKQHPDCFVVQYMRTAVDRESFSERMLLIGEIGFYLQYASDDWRSNVGNVEIAVTKQFHFPALATMPYPIYAIDFITTDNLAIDFNTAPGLDPVKKYITASEIYDQVEAWYELHPEVQVS